MNYFNLPGFRPRQRLRGRGLHRGVLPRDRLILRSNFKNTVSFIHPLSKTTARGFASVHLSGRSDEDSKKKFLCRRGFICLYSATRIIKKIVSIPQLLFFEGKSNAAKFESCKCGKATIGSPATVT